jgi:hypothetical protein
VLTFETTAIVDEDGRMTIRGPHRLPPGEYRAVIVIGEPVAQRPSVKFSDMSEFRKSLGAPVYPGNTIVEMRED